MKNPDVPSFFDGWTIFSLCVPALSIPFWAANVGPDNDYDPIWWLALIGAEVFILLVRAIQVHLIVKRVREVYRKHIPDGVCWVMELPVRCTDFEPLDMLTWYVVVAQVPEKRAAEVLSEKPLIRMRVEKEYVKYIEAHQIAIVP